MNYRRGYYKKDGTYVQGHFVKKPSRRMKRRKTNKGCLGSILVTGMILMVLACESSSDCDSNCSDYASQTAAQATFDADRNCHANLDRDNDGIACEN